MDGADRDKYWTAWTAHCALYGASLDPETTYPDINKLLTFAVAMREGQYGRGAQVKVQSVKKLSGTLPKSLFWMYIQTPEKLPQPSNPLTSPSPAC